jgi:ubiquitin C-terminal hydrolase
MQSLPGCQQISQKNADFTEIILSFPQDKSQISLNELIHRDFRMEQLDDKLCTNCNNSDTSEVTTSIHTHPDVLIIMLKQHEYINNKPGRELMDSSQIKALKMLKRLQNTTSLLPFAIKNQEI